ncbi:hypothetical protein FV139_14340 [Parahaliea maris]|uniref:Uncharacterized protein n=1 Tax=Parahaliea maris TaxID=2716870 RepID=A0A5C8ZWQ5_9GAMM|nr:hypothetical protein [Parahaliea maris]TXS91907.1 hypothetical protein FV139_14340 [Parahaliea maris]
MRITPLVFATAFALASATNGLQANEPLATLADVPAVKMTSDELAQVRGEGHVRLLVLQQTGKTELPTAAAAAATDAAGSIGAVGNDRPAILRLLN